jgi:hypothetical protein
VILVATIHNTTAQHLTVLPNTSISLRPANISTSLEILGEYHRQGYVLQHSETACTRKPPQHTIFSDGMKPAFFKIYQRNIYNELTDTDNVIYIFLLL